jgi:hypothetical protein
MAELLIGRRAFEPEQSGTAADPFPAEVVRPQVIAAVGFCVVGFGLSRRFDWMDAKYDAPPVPEKPGNYMQAGASRQNANSVSDVADRCPSLSRRRNGTVPVG